MEEKNPMVIVFEKLGEKIVELEEKLSTERLFRDMAENNAKKLTEENESLRAKLRDVEAYIERARELNG